MQASFLGPTNRLQCLWFVDKKIAITQQNNVDLMAVDRFNYVWLLLIAHLTD